jgi:hypothetical protein
MIRSLVKVFGVVGGNDQPQQQILILLHMEVSIKCQ